MSEEKEVLEDDVLDEAESQIYEIGFHLVPLLAQEQVGGEASKMKALVEKFKGAIISDEMPKLRPLAYDISKMIGGKKHTFDKAYFGSIKFELPSDKIASVEEALKSDENILRFLLIKTVRESTLAPLQRIATHPKKEGDKPVLNDAPKEGEKKPVSVEEIDKSIDELLK